MSQTNIQQLNEFGQSVWLDYLSRSIIKSGKLKEMIGLGLRGMTSNPTIFEKSIGQSNDYDEYIINSCIAGQSTFEIYDDLTIKDIQDAADMFLPLYEESNGLDGYVSLEINPNLAYKAEETIEEGKRLRKKVNRPNVMFKVPATDQSFTFDRRKGEGFMLEIVPLPGAVWLIAGSAVFNVNVVDNIMIIYKSVGVKN